MSPRHPRSSAPAPRPGERGLKEELKSLRLLAPHLWPRDRADLRFRVLLAVLCLIVAKLVNLGVPLL